MAGLSCARQAASSDHRTVRAFSFLTEARSTRWPNGFLLPVSTFHHACQSLQVNGIAFHPVHGTLATVGSDGRFSFWDKDARTKLKTSEQLDQPISACCFNHNGNIFAYASSYDWSKVRVPGPTAPLMGTSGHTNHHSLVFPLLARSVGQLALGGALAPGRSEVSCPGKPEVRGNHPPAPRGLAPRGQPSWLESGSRLKRVNT